MTEEEKKRCHERLLALVLEVDELEEKKKASAAGYAATIKILKDDIKKYSEAIDKQDMTILQGDD